MNLTFQSRFYLLIASFALHGVMNAANLYKAEDFTNLTSDRKPRHAGDILTIVVIESSSASNSADNVAAKSVNLGIDYKPIRGRGDGASLQMGDSFNGRAKTQFTGKLLAQLGVSVQEVLPNGDLRVKGEQAIDINGEKTNIKIEGKVRSQDVTDNNTVLSSKLAEAKISYVGDGFISESAKPGFIQKIFRWLGLW
jgi:flagellar L-ring protein FlgH